MMASQTTRPQAAGTKKPLPASKPDYVVKAATPSGQQPVPQAPAQQNS